jgi:hypothetical protein
MQDILHALGMGAMRIGLQENPVADCREQGFSYKVTL